MPKEIVQPTLEILLERVAGYLPGLDTEVLRRAYALSAQAHEGQRRLTGEPFITHPLSVALLLTELEMDAPTLAAALLHDVVEDTGISLSQLEEQFGEEIAGLVDGVTKLRRVQFTSQRHGFRYKFAFCPQTLLTGAAKCAIVHS